MSTDNQALIFGASGISGWALCKNLLCYPSGTSFSKVTGLTHRALSLADSALPADPRLNLISGIDLRSSTENVIRQLRDVGVEGITHVYYVAYTSAEIYKELCETNLTMLRNAATAVDLLCPKLETFVLQTGTKYYGAEFSAHIPISAPLKESFPRIPAPWSKNIFYYPQKDFLAELSSNKSWRWLDVRPDVIVGFVPNNNLLSAAQPLALYMSLYAAVHGRGAKIPFPGTRKSWKNMHTGTSQDVLAQFSIFASLRTNESGEAYNIADGPATTWSYLWPKVASWFGLEGVEPDETAKTPREWWAEHREAYGVMKEALGLKEREPDENGWAFLDLILVTFDVDRHFDLTKARNLGWVGEPGVAEKGWLKAFEMMADHGQIPKRAE